jgi:hypothetical protein
MEERKILSAASSTKYRYATIFSCKNDPSCIYKVYNGAQFGRIVSVALEIYKRMKKTFPKTVSQWFGLLPVFSKSNPIPITVGSNGEIAIDESRKDEKFVAIRMTKVKGARGQQPLRINFNTFPAAQIPEVAKQFGYVLAWLHHDVRTTAADLQFLYGSTEEDPSPKFYLIDPDLYQFYDYNTRENVLPRFAHHLSVEECVYAHDNEQWNNFVTGYLSYPNLDIAAAKFIAMLEFCSKNVIGGGIYPQFHAYLLSTNAYMNTTLLYGDQTVFMQKLFEDFSRNKVENSGDFWPFTYTDNSGYTITIEKISDVKILDPILQKYLAYMRILPFDEGCQKMGFCLPIDSVIWHDKHYYHMFSDPKCCSLLKCPVENESLEDVQKMGKTLAFLHKNGVFPVNIVLGVTKNSTFFLNWYDWRLNDKDPETNQQLSAEELISISKFYPLDNMTLFKDVYFTELNRK